MTITLVTAERRFICRSITGTDEREKKKTQNWGQHGWFLPDAVARMCLHNLATAIFSSAWRKLKCDGRRRKNATVLNVARCVSFSGSPVEKHLAATALSAVFFETASYKTVLHLLFFQRVPGEPSLEMRYNLNTANIALLVSCWLLGISEPESFQTFSISYVWIWNQRSFCSLVLLKIWCRHHPLSEKGEQTLGSLIHCKCHVTRMPVTRDLVLWWVVHVVVGVNQLWTSVPLLCTWFGIYCLQCCHIWLWFAMSLQVSCACISTRM